MNIHWAHSETLPVTIVWWKMHFVFWLCIFVAKSVLLVKPIGKKIYFFAIKNAINFLPFAKAHIFCSNFAPWHKKFSFFREILFWPKLVFWLISHNIFALHNRAIANLFRQSKTSFNQSNLPICLCLMLTSSYALLQLKMMMTMMQWNVTKRIETCSFHWSVLACRTCKTNDSI